MSDNINIKIKLKDVSKAFCLSKQSMKSITSETYSHSPEQEVLIPHKKIQNYNKVYWQLIDCMALVENLCKIRRAEQHVADNLVRSSIDKEMEEKLSIIQAQKNKVVEFDDDKITLSSLYLNEAQESSSTKEQDC